MLLNLRAYHRPETLAAAIQLLQTGHAALLAGGTELLGRDDDQIDAVIDLAPLGLSYTERDDLEIRIGATTTLRRVAENPSLKGLAGGILSRAILQAAPATIRAAATLGGTLAGKQGGDEIPTVLLAMGARAMLATPDPVELPLALLLANKAEALAGAIITEIRIPATSAPGGYAAVSRTPADRAIVCAAAVGERLAIGGVAPTPTLVARVDEEFAAWPAVTDGRGSADYRRQVAPIILRRAIEEARG